MGSLESDLDHVVLGVVRVTVKTMKIGNIATREYIGRKEI